LTNVISVKYASIIAVAAFVAGSFVASPELRAYAAATITSADIVNETIQSVDIKNGEVKAADIGADAVGGSELQGVTKLLFGQCVLTSGENFEVVLPGNGLLIGCNISGVDSDDSASATMTSGSNCFAVTRADASSSSGVIVIIRNVCKTNQIPGSGSEIAVIVYDK
ncbi:MAG: hypothetical protein ACRD5H_16440, partial [Nitrososphaerales archaeon]